MLVLSRKKGQTIRIGEEILVKIIEIKGGIIRVGIEAPTEVPILRSELIADKECPARIEVAANGALEVCDLHRPTLPRRPR